MASKESSSSAASQNPELVRRALCNLFSNLYKDEGLSGTRKFHEQVNASTKTQTKLAGISSRPDISLPKLSTKLADEFESKRKAAKASRGSSLNKQEKDEINREILDRFRQTYSWLTSVRMDTNSNGTIKSGANEDEHALPFGFMLVFGGAIASVPGDYTQQTSILKAFTEYLDSERTEESPVPELINRVLKNIGHVGRDISLLYRTDDVVLDILSAMRVDDYQSFLKNSLTLNYYGIFLSEKDSNQWKSNLVFVKLVEADDGTIRLEPWDALIKVFIDAVAEKLKAAFSNTEGAAQPDWKSLVSLVKEREGTRANNTVYPGGSATNKGVHREVLKNMKAVFDVSGVQEWKETARANMTYIIQFLCDHYNKDLPQRTFFNCVLLKYNESFGNTRTKNRPQGGVAGRESRKAAMANAVNATPPSKMKPEAPSATKSNELKMVQQTRTAIDDYICAYSEQYNIEFTENHRLQDILNSCKKPKSMRELAPPPKKGRWSGGGRKTRRRKRRRKTKQRRKRKKNTKRKKRRKRKKKTKKKR